MTDLVEGRNYEPWFRGTTTDDDYIIMERSFITLIDWSPVHRSDRLAYLDTTPADFFLGNSQLIIEDIRFNIMKWWKEEEDTNSELKSCLDLFINDSF